MTIRDAVSAVWSRSRLGASVVLVLILGVFAWGFGPPLYASLKFRLDPRDPFLSSRSPRRLGWIVGRVKQYVPRGGRLLYEESGFGIPGLADPYHGGRFSGLLPYYTGVELIGGPYLHAALTTNFTQFGEGKLFGKADWGRDHFVRYAKLYRPDAILCWTPHARRFCRENPDLIEILDQDGPLLLGRVIGFGGPTIEGKAAVVSSPGRLHVRFDPAELDRRIVLRYHSVPSLRSRPPARLEAVRLEGDPVPFIGLRPPPGATTLELGVVP